MSAWNSAVGTSVVRSGHESSLLGQHLARRRGRVCSDEQFRRRNADASARMQNSRVRDPQTGIHRVSGDRIPWLDREYARDRGQITDG